MADDKLHLTLGTLAPEFGLSRDVLRRMLSERAIAPAGRRGGHPIYRLKDAIAAVLAERDPDEMNPHSRLALARSIQTEDTIRTRRRELIERQEVEAEMASMMKVVAEAFDTLPDILERDCGLTPDVLAKVENCLDKAREELHRRLAEEEIS